MCFSAGASFAASGVLAVAGVIAIKEAKFTSKLGLAAMPFLFSIQQFSEGMVWTAFTKPGYENFAHQATIFFLIFAKVVWPVWVPVSILMIEKKTLNKRLLLVLSFMGAMVSVYELYYILTSSVSASIDCNHILYNVIVPENTSTLITALYLISTVIPAFVSSLKKTNLLGIVLVISLIVSQLFYENTLVSVWCFFASILSIIIIYILYELRKENSVKVQFT
jgi:hypothetical protein